LSLTAAYVLRSLDHALEKEARATRELDAERALLAASNAALTEAASELRVQAESRARLEVALAETRQLEALGVLAAGIAHDFNNLLTPVLANATLLRADLQGDQAALASDIASAAERGRDLVRRLLSPARLRTIARGTVDPAPLVAEVVRLVRSTARPGTSVDLRIDEDAGHVYADRADVHRIVMNLAVNAQRALRHDGGRVSIALERSRVDDTVHLVVEDDGVGMDADTVARAFDPRFTTHELEGFGLGLTAVRDTVRQLGGSVELETMPGHGTRLVVALPRIEPPPREAGRPAPLPIAPVPLRVLVVDDDRAVRKSLARLLERRGCVVAAARSGDEALVLLARAEPFDLLVTDQDMPGMTGLELARRAHESATDLPVVLVTGYPETDAAFLSAAGVRRVVSKPVGDAELDDILRDVLPHASGLDAVH